jgi:hypothetical protein
MKARVNEIESGKDYKDKQRRITLKFEGASSCFDKITIPESELGWAAGAAQLDDELEITIRRVNMPYGLALEPLSAVGPGFVPNPVGELVRNETPAPVEPTPISDEGIPF